MDNRKQDLSNYRLSQSEDSLKVATLCFSNGIFKDSINRSYYAAFYAIKAVLALEEIDFKRHKDVIGYFNKTYVATEIFPKILGRKIGMLQQLREKSDYDDFFIAAKEDAELQISTAQELLELAKAFVASHTSK